MAVYRFKITFEEEEEVYRLIEIRSTHTFKDFHEAIQTAIGFDNSKSASFYMSDDYWRKGTEIRLTDDTTDASDVNGKPRLLMNKAKLAGYIEDPHQKMLYLFDFDANWNFNIELIKIIVDEDVTAKYPRCVKSAGTAPKQYKPTVVPIVNEDDDDDEDEEPKTEKIFHHEEAFDKEGDDELEGEEGELEEAPEEGGDEPAASEEEDL